MWWYHARDIAERDRVSENTTGWVARPYGTINAELRALGWTCVTGVNGRSELIDLARTIGRPIPSATGEIVKELLPNPQAQARKGTLSAKYATGSFPLHTDTAFWALPSRYLVLRVRGDVRRDTTVLSFARLFEKGTSDLRTLAEHSVWLVRTPTSAMYCSMRFGSQAGRGWRYDPHCMSPVNDFAFRVREQIDSLLASSRVECIHWKSDLAVVVCNWEVLHGRGTSPPRETSRILERIYVE